MLTIFLCQEIDCRAQKAKDDFDVVQGELFALVTNSESDAIKLSNLLMEFPKLQVRQYTSFLRTFDRTNAMCVHVCF